MNIPKREPTPMATMYCSQRFRINPEATVMSDLSDIIVYVQGLKESCDTVQIRSQ